MNKKNLMYAVIVMNLIFLLVISSIALKLVSDGKELKLLTEQVELLREESKLTHNSAEHVVYALEQMARSISEAHFHTIAAHGYTRYLYELYSGASIESALEKTTNVFENLPHVFDRYVAQSAFRATLSENFIDCLDNQYDFETFARG